MSTLVVPTLAQIRQRVRFYIDEPIQANFLDSDINWAINDMQQFVVSEIAQVDEKYFVSTTPTVIVMTAQQQYYPLAADFFKMTRLEDQATGLMIPFTEIDSQNNFFQTPIPPLVSITQAGYAAMIVGNSVGFTPMPTTTGTVVQYFYVPLAPDMTSDSDTSVVPRMFIDLLAIQAAIDCFIKDEDDTSALEAKYNRRFSQLVRVARDRQQQNPKKVRRVGDTTQYPGWSM
jgi:hypothetical protein